MLKHNFFPLTCSGKYCAWFDSTLPRFYCYIIQNKLLPKWTSCCVVVQFKLVNVTVIYSGLLKFSENKSTFLLHRLSKQPAACHSLPAEHSVWMLFVPEAASGRAKKYITCCSLGLERLPSKFFYILHIFQAFVSTAQHIIHTVRLPTLKTC